MSNNLFDDRAFRSSRDRRFESRHGAHPAGQHCARNIARASVRQRTRRVRAVCRLAKCDLKRRDHAVDQCPFVTTSSRRYIGLHARTPVAERSAAPPPSPAHRPYANGTCFPFVTVQTAARRTVLIVFLNCGVHGPPMDRHGCSRAAYLHNMASSMCVCNCTTNFRRNTCVNRWRS